MKIRCSLCGKKYELSHNGAQCPECGQRNYSKDAPLGGAKTSSIQSALGGDLEERAAERFASDQTHMKAHTDAHSDLHKMYDGGGHHVEEPKSFSPHYSVNDNTSNNLGAKSPIKLSLGGRGGQKPRTCAYYFVMVVLIQIIAVLFMVSGVMKTSLKDAQDKFATGDIISAEHELEDGYTYYFFDLFEYTFAIGSVEDNHDGDLVTWNIPEGYEVVMYIFEYFTNQDDYYGFYDEGDLTEIYAVTKDGRYIQPLASYEAEELIAEDPYGSMDLIVSDLGYQYGYICFLVKEDDIDYIIIDEYSSEADDRKLEMRHELK